MSKGSILAASMVGMSYGLKSYGIDAPGLTQFFKPPILREIRGPVVKPPTNGARECARRVSQRLRDEYNQYTKWLNQGDEI